MSDIVERLRACYCSEHCKSGCIQEKAAAEIERLTMALEMFMRDEKTAAQNVAMLRAENERLRAALETIENAPEGPNLVGSIQAMRDKARRALGAKSVQNDKSGE